MSSKIIKGLDSNYECRILDLRHSFKDREAQEKSSAGAGGQEQVPAINYGKLAAVLIREAEEKAERIIFEAQQRAANILDEARTKAEEESGILKSQAMQEGFEEGRREALAKAAADASSIRDQARLVLRQAEETRRQTIESMESELVRLAIEISEKIILSKLNLDPGVVVEIAKEAIGMLHKRDQVVLYVNPSEADFYEERRSELIKQLSPRGELIIISDPEIGPGGCIAETENGRVDALVDSRWQALMESLGEIYK
ncbi:MAG: FliH/SctL family protein [Bacillota bacterium]